MATRSKNIDLKVSEHINEVNPENMKLLDKYIIDMNIRNVSPNSQYQYVATLKQWLVYILLYQNNRSVLELNGDDITQFIYFCTQYGNNASRNKVRISAISMFYKVMRQNRLMVENPTEFVKAPRNGTPILSQTYLTLEQVAIMREKLIDYGDTQIRMYAMLSLSTMARVSALASIKWSQIDLVNYTIHDVLEKEGKIVDLYFNDEAKQLLIKVKKEREEKNINDHGWLFYSCRTTPTKHINKTTLNSWCKLIGGMIGIETFHPHDFRHTGANNLKRAGMPLEDVSVLLNHESTETTKKFYIKKDTSRINAMKSRLNL